MFDTLWILIFVQLFTVLSSTLSGSTLSLFSAFLTYINFFLVLFSLFFPIYFLLPYSLSYLIFDLLLCKVQVLNFLECAKHLQDFCTIFALHFLPNYPLYMNFICCNSLSPFFLFGGTLSFLSGSFYPTRCHSSLGACIPHDFSFVNR